MKAIADFIPHVVVHSSLSPEMDFEHSKALTVILQDCTDEQIIAEIAQRRADQQNKDIVDQVHEKYHFERIIGEGSSGTVHLVTELETEKKYACKVLVKNKMNDAASMATEIEIMRNVKHENVIQLHEVFETRECLWLMIELTRNDGLRGIMQVQSYLSEKLTCRLIKQLLEGVHYLHSEGIIHRDLKIDNILFDGDVETGAVKISDFGLSAQVTLGSLGYHPTDSAKRKKYTGIHDRWGTVTHCSPELLFKNAYGPQTDMWSLGCMMYEMLTGSTAFPQLPSDRKYKNVNLYRKIRGSIYDKEKLQEVSACGRMFLERLLEVNPNKRLTASEALLHPWLTCRLTGGTLSSIIRPPSPILSAISRVLVPLPEKIINSPSAVPGKGSIMNKLNIPSPRQPVRQNPLQEKFEMVTGGGSLLEARNVTDSLKLSRTPDNTSKEKNVKTLMSTNNELISRIVRMMSVFRL